MSDAVSNSRTPGTAAWRLHGYIKRAGSITCRVIHPDGGLINEALADFAQQAGGREWDNDPEDIQAMLELAATQEMRHDERN